MVVQEDYNDKGIDFIKLLINEMMPILKDARLSNKEVMQELNEYFSKKIAYLNLSLNMNTNQKKEKLVKI